VAKSTPTAHTLAFVREFLPPRSVALLEIGAGDGELSLALSALEYSVVAIDSDPAAVATMQGRGLNAVNTAWPAYEGPAVSAVIFSRSLHHLPLEPAVKRAASLLVAGGRLIVEDFAFAEVPASAVAWLRSWINRLVARGVWRTPSHGFLAGVRDGHSFTPSAVEDHEIADAVAMRRVLVAHGTLIHEVPAAYFYRYLMTGLPNTAAGNTIVREILDEETASIEQGGLWPLGRRWVVEP
jgi:SAM-dependent methyltransferase